MEISLKGKNAVVTGGAHGIGRAMAECLQACGASVHIFDIDHTPVCDVHTAANEFGPFGVQVNAVNPRLIRTHLTQTAFDSPAVIKDS